MIGSAAFEAWGTVILAGWSMVLAGSLGSPGGRWSSRLIRAGGFWTPVVLSAVWAVAFAALLPRTGDGDLFTLDGVVAKFADRDRLVLLYLECLTLSLFVGGWMAADSRDQGVSRWGLALILPLQCLLGPAGLALYVAVRARKPTPTTSRALS